MVPDLAERDGSAADIRQRVRFIANHSKTKKIQQSRKIAPFRSVVFYYLDGIPIAVESQYLADKDANPLILRTGFKRVC